MLPFQPADLKDRHAAVAVFPVGKQNLRHLLGLPQDVIRRASICMYEGEINMVIHADGGQAEVEIDPSQILIRMTDTGPGIPDVEQAMQEGFSTASAEVRSLGFGAGMGLPNMKRYTDEFEIQSTVGVGTTITMRVNIA